MCIYLYIPHILAIGVLKLNSANHGHRNKLHSHIGSTVCRASGSLFVHDYKLIKSHYIFKHKQGWIL